jgi:hypothetical protein
VSPLWGSRHFPTFPFLTHTREAACFLDTLPFVFASYNVAHAVHARDNASVWATPEGIRETFSVFLGVSAELSAIALITTATLTTVTLTTVTLLRILGNLTGPRRCLHSL